MQWEAERYDWAALRMVDGTAEAVPAAIEQLSAGAGAQQISRGYWSIDNNVVVQGALTEAAAPTAACLCVALTRTSGPARAEIAELLVQLGSGQETYAPAGTRQRIVDEIRGVAATVFGMLEHGTKPERVAAVDLLVLLAAQDGRLLERALWYARRLGAEPGHERLGHLAVGWLQDLGARGFEDQAADT